MAEILKIQVSFKRTEKHLYDMVAEQGDMSNFMKDALKFYLKYRDGGINKTPKNEKEDTSEILGILDFDD
jgi:hypothetical protein